MARNKVYEDKAKISTARQLIALRQRYETVRYELKPNKLIWEGVIQPTVLSGRYTIRIVYEMNSVPLVYLKKPKLLFPNGQKPPHIYKGKNLCLYYPPNGEWTAKKIIASTIIPWTSLWLKCYEIWLATGKWEGGGFHPNTK